MRIREFNRANTNVKGRGEKAFISFQEKNGTISLSVAACRKMNVSVGDMVQLVQDEDDLKAWYIEVVKKDGFIIKKYSHSSAFTFNSARIVREIFTACGTYEQYHRCPIGEPVYLGSRELWSIITAAIK